MNKLTVAVCTYNRADRLPDLIKALRSQSCSVSYEILIIDNDSTDNTQEVLSTLTSMNGVPLRVVKEMQQGIVPARNRAIKESEKSTYLFFMDDDELPFPGLLEAAVDALENENADCVGGKVEIFFGAAQRPDWLEDNLLGFLAEVNYGERPFWIVDDTTPVWTANVAYKTNLFKNGLRFDIRYTRIGKQIGGGEDVVMFENLLNSGARIRYRSDMAVKHFVEEWRLRRRYFLKLHYIAGRKKGLWELDDYPRSFLGVPPFLLVQIVNHFIKTFKMLFTNSSGVLRQAMNGTHACGMMVGLFLKWKKRKKCGIKRVRSSDKKRLQFFLKKINFLKNPCSVKK